MSHGGSGVTSPFNTDQKTIINAYAGAHSDMDEGAYYLFFVAEVVDKAANIAGYMPLTYNTGFIYGMPTNSTIAHELGHGAFNLRHTFSTNGKVYIAAEGETQNLMDYAGDSELWAYQWDYIHDPENILFAWSVDESESEYVKGDCEAALESLQKTYKEGDEILWQSYSENEVQLITPDIYLGSKDDIEWFQYLSQFYDLFRYTCSGNETFQSIASDFGTTTAEQIIRFNQGVTISEGIEIVIPPSEDELEILLTPSYINCYSLLHKQRAVYGNLLYVLGELIRINNNLLDIEELKKMYGQAILADFSMSMIPVIGQIKSIIEIKMGKNLAHYVVLEKINDIPVSDFKKIDYAQSLIDATFGGVTVLGKYTKIINSESKVYNIVGVTGDVNGLMDFGRTTNGLIENE